MRKAVNGLMVLVQNTLEADPFSSHLLVLSNRLQVIWFQYADRRRGDVPQTCLFPKGEKPPGGSMYLMTDGYEGYNALTKSPAILGHGACWAHLRRRFVEATHGRKNTTPAAHQMVALIRKLYIVETAAKEMSPDARKALHHEQTEPLLEKIKAWFD